MYFYQRYLKVVVAVVAVVGLVVIKMFVNIMNHSQSIAKNTKTAKLTKIDLYFPRPKRRVGWAKRCRSFDRRFYFVHSFRPEDVNKI